MTTSKSSHGITDMGMQQTIALLDVTETATFTNAAPAPVLDMSICLLYTSDAADE